MKTSRGTGAVGKILLGLGLLLGVYLIGRAIAEPFVIDAGNPATYRDDWGGPTLAGVLAVHCGAGVLAAVLIGGWARRSARRRAGTRPDRPLTGRGAA